MARRPSRVQVAPRSVRLGLLGLGTVGTGVLEVLARNQEEIERRLGHGIEVARVLVRDTERPRSPLIARDRLTTSADAILSDPEIRIVLEVMGGCGDALAHMLRALRSGRAVVTANKDAMAEHASELFAAAAAGKGPGIFFEASVGGGIPIVRAVQDSLAANRLRRIAGILNGTTNYILTRMGRDGTTLEAALAQAQAHGYAEADPASDLDGLDAARKLCILSSLAYGTRCRLADVHCEGIRAVQPVDIAHAARMGWVVKLLAISELVDERVSMRVHPAFLPLAHPLAAVHDAFNGIFVQGDAVGEAMFYGRGAGALPTASAVLGDVMEAVRGLDGAPPRLDCTRLHRRPVARMGGVVSRFYVRLQVPDRVGVLARIAHVLGKAGVSILSVLQAPLSTPHAAAQEVGDGLAELVIVTHTVRDAAMRRAMAELERLDVVVGVGAVVRLAPEDL